MLLHSGHHSESREVLVPGCDGGELGPWREVSLALRQRISFTREGCFGVCNRNVGHSDMYALLMTFFTTNPPPPLQYSLYTCKAGLVYFLVHCSSCQTHGTYFRTKKDNGGSA